MEVSFCIFSVNYFYSVRYHYKPRPAALYACAGVPAGDTVCP